MQYLVALSLPEPHENRRQRVLNAALDHLTVHGDAEIVGEETGVRFSRRAGAVPSIFRVTRIAIEEPEELEAAVERVERAIDSANNLLRSLGLANVQIAIFIQPPARRDGADAKG
jgi:hypothetical protein